MESRESVGRGTAELLTKLGEFFSRYVEFAAESQPLTLALWVLHTWALDAAEITPYILVTSPEKRSGKTRLLEASELVVADPLMTESISPAALFRLVEEERPTLLLDEIDAIFNGQDRETLRGIINAGYTRRGKAVRVVGDGSRMQVRKFASFCPKAFAGIDNGKFPLTIADRSIRIRLQRKVGGSRVHRFRARRLAAETKPIRDALRAWTKGSIELLRDADPALPAELSDRAQDIWEPLIAIADLAAGDWPRRARSAAVALCSDPEIEGDTLRVQCLAAVRTVFDERGAESLPTKEIIAVLNRREDSPWPSMRDGHGINERGLSNQLRPFGIRPRTIRPEMDGYPATVKGYKRQSFEDAWARYLPTAIGPVDPSRRHNPRKAADRAPVRAVTPNEPATDEPRSRSRPGPQE